MRSYNLAHDTVQSVKTKVQTRALAGEQKRGVWETFHRLIRGSSFSCQIDHIMLTIDIMVGPDPNAPKPIFAGLTRIYRGLGISALRSVTTHGLLWTFFDLVSGYIDRLPEPSHPRLL